MTKEMARPMLDKNNRIREKETVKEREKDLQDMRKVQFCPQTRFCGLEMSTIFAMYNRQFNRI